MMRSAYTSGFLVCATERSRAVTFWGLGLLAALLLAGFLAIVPATLAFARTVEAAWTVEYDFGGKLVDKGTADILKTVSDLQPGDSAEFNVTLFENYDGAADWYMKNEVFATMEETFEQMNAQGGSYRYRLIYTNPAGAKKVLISNDAVSGDGDMSATNGLKDATSGVTDWFFLDRLQPQEAASVKLEVSLDGETHGNTYFDSEARLNLSFAVEPVAGNEPPAEPVAGNEPPAEPAQPDDELEEEGNGTTLLGRLAQTGDLLPLGILAAVVLVAVGVSTAVAVRRRWLPRKGGVR